MSQPEHASVDTHSRFLSKKLTIVSFQRTAEIILCARSQATGTAGVVKLRTVDARAIGSFIAEVGQGTKTSELIVKAVGSAEQIQQLEVSLKNLGVSKLHGYVAQTTKLEGYFYSDSARMRVAELGRERRAPTPQPIAKTSATAGKKEELVKKRVLIVDDSKTIRQVLRKILSQHSYLEVVGEAEKPSEVSALIEKLKPDVMTLDINMPEMTGVDLLQKLFPAQYLPTVMISSVSLTEGREVIRALELGAVDYIQKPEFSEIEKLAPSIQTTVYQAALARSRSARRAGVQSGKKVEALDTSRFLAVGASTGGTEAIRSFFMQLPMNCPPIGVVQHIPPYFSTAFAQRLNELCAFEVREAKNGDRFQSGLALIAPGGQHLEVVNEGGVLKARITDAPPVNRFKPSVDVFFNSVAQQIGKSAVGVLLTGMGDDGARGLLKMKQTGSLTIAESEESCVVFGMPRAAIEMGGAQTVASLEEIALHLPTMSSIRKSG